MISVAISLVVCILGLILYLLTTGAPAPRSKWAEIGMKMFWVGLLVFLLRWTPVVALGAGAR